MWKSTLRHLSSQKPSSNCLSQATLPPGSHRPPMILGSSSAEPFVSFRCVPLAWFDAICSEEEKNRMGEFIFSSCPAFFSLVIERGGGGRTGSVARLSSLFVVSMLWKEIKLVTLLGTGKERGSEHTKSTGGGGWLEQRTRRAENSDSEKPLRKRKHQSSNLRLIYRAYTCCCSSSVPVIPHSIKSFPLLLLLFCLLLRLLHVATLTHSCVVTPTTETEKKKKKKEKELGAEKK